jgi:hypothetical protein
MGAVVVALACAGGFAAQGLGGLAGQSQLPSVPTVNAPGEVTQTAETAQALFANERKINDAIAKGDVAAFRSLVSNTAISTDQTGASPFARVMNQVKIVDGQLYDFKILWAGNNAAVVTYTWMGKGTFMGQPMTSPSYASTVWMKLPARWVAIYHQETAGAPLGPKK